MRDAESFDEFYRSTSARLMRYGYAVVGDLTEAQDVVQEAYTRAWQRWRTVAVHPHPEAWVRLVVTRLAADRWRRLARWQAILSRSGPPESVHPPSEDTVVVVAALRRLPVAQRQALALHYLFDQPVAEIAEETGVAVGTVTSWLSRGRAGLAQALTGTAPPGRSGRQTAAPTLVAPPLGGQAGPVTTRPAAGGVREGNDDE
jgi:RNA polymerase sigma-70 factor (ECF subfamily)